MVIPAKVRREARIDKGDILAVEPEGDGRILLIRLDRPKQIVTNARAKIIQRRGAYPVGDIGRTITREEIKTALAGFP